MEPYRKKFIDKCFNGDMDAYKDWIKYGETEVICWKDIESSVKTFPDREQFALAWIRYALGYLPERHIVLPHLSFIQALIQNGRGGIITKESFSDEMIFHMKRVRNDDLKKGGWLILKAHDAKDYSYYNTYLAQHRDAARNRHTQFLGYEPILDHSMLAEIFMREQIEANSSYLSTQFCDIDYKAGTITKYREKFLTEGESAADALELLGFHCLK